jgi:ferricrocin synthase
MGNKKSRAARLVLNPDALSYTPTSSLLHAPVARHASEQPFKTAVSFLHALDEPPRTLSYADLDNQSTLLASSLRKLFKGTGIKEPVVALALPPSIELYIAYIAVLKAGFAFSPLPAPEETPAERLRTLVHELDAKIILGLAERQSWAEEIDSAQWVSVSEGIASGVDGERWPAPSKNDLAYSA